MLGYIIAAAEIEPAQIIRTVIVIAEAVLAIALVITIFFQPANTTGVSAIDNQETYYTKNKKKSTEGFMRMASVVISILMAALAMAFFVTLIFNSTGV